MEEQLSCTMSLYLASTPLLMTVRGVFSAFMIVCINPLNFSHSHASICSSFITLCYVSGGKIAVYGDSNCLDSAHLQRGIYINIWGFRAC